MSSSQNIRESGNRPTATSNNFSKNSIVGGQSMAQAQSVVSPTQRGYQESQWPNNQHTLRKNASTSNVELQFPKKSLLHQQVYSASAFHSNENLHKTKSETEQIGLRMSQSVVQTRGKGKEASSLQGEIKIKFTDSAKVLDEDNVQPLINPSQNNNDNKIDIIVTFAMACGETQNFSVPLYSGVFMFKQSIDPKRKHGDKLVLQTIESGCMIDQLIEKKKQDKIYTNLKSIIEKAIKLKQDKIFLRQDQFFKIEGQIKSIFHTEEEVKSAMVRLRITDTHANRSTTAARSHFAEFGISASYNQNAVKQAYSLHHTDRIEAYPDQCLDQLQYTVPLKCSFTCPQDVWQQHDQTFKDKFSQLIKEMKHDQQSRLQDASGPNRSFLQTNENTEQQSKFDSMDNLSRQVSRLGKQASASRTFSFNSAQDLKLFLFYYKMNIERCLKMMAMDQNCTKRCSERPIHQFGLNCEAPCSRNAETMLTQGQRHVILYSMIFIDSENKNLHPDVREHLWLRASGATQLKKSYQDYQVDGLHNKDYYDALKESPDPPNSSFATILADQPRISFDVTVTEKSHHLKQIALINHQSHMQSKFANVMKTYHKRNGAFIYNQSQSEILIRILEVVFKENVAFWLYCVLLETILPLNFYTNTLYPQAFLEYTIQLVKGNDKGFFAKSGDAINFFCLKSYYSLFTNLIVEPNSNCEKSEMAYFMLDILFLLGDARRSTTLLDDPFSHSDFNVGETIPRSVMGRNPSETGLQTTRVRIDRTSQLLIAMSITIAEYVKFSYNRHRSKDKEQMIRQLSGFEEIVRKTLINKSAVLTYLLNIEIYFFSRRKNEAIASELYYDAQQTNLKKREQQIDQFEKWRKANHDFGVALDNTKDFTDRRMDRNPRIKTSVETANTKYLDKVKFLTKFSCFEGYMQFIDCSERKDKCQGLDFEEFKATLKSEVDIKRATGKSGPRYESNYLQEETLVRKVNCGGYLEQPFCLYDFTVKTLSHDCLNFSTRHMSKDGRQSYIDTNWFKKAQRFIPRKQSKLSQTSRLPKSQFSNEIQNQNASLIMTANDSNTTQALDFLQISEDQASQVAMNQKEMFGARYSTMPPPLRPTSEMLTFTLDKSQIPSCLPIQRGIHLCNDKFVKTFRTSYDVDATELAQSCSQNGAISQRKQGSRMAANQRNQPQDFSMVDLDSKQARNALFNPKINELLYARDLFPIVKIEGSLSNARAMAQLREYYLRMMRHFVTQKVPREYLDFGFWERQRQLYQDQVKTMAQNKKSGNSSAQSAQWNENLQNDAIREIISRHSDMTFLSWPSDSDSQVKVFCETSANQRQRARNDKLQRVMRNKYRHLMIGDDKDRMPFASSAAKSSNLLYNSLAQSQKQIDSSRAHESIAESLRTAQSRNDLHKRESMRVQCYQSEVFSNGSIIEDHFDQQTGALTSEAVQRACNKRIRASGRLDQWPQQQQDCADHALEESKNGQQRKDTDQLRQRQGLKGQATNNLNVTVSQQTRKEVPDSQKIEDGDSDDCNEDFKSAKNSLEFDQQEANDQHNQTVFLPSNSPHRSSMLDQNIERMVNQMGQSMRSYHRRNRQSIRIVGQQPRKSNAQQKTAAAEMIVKDSLQQASTKTEEDPNTHR